MRGELVIVATDGVLAQLADAAVALARLGRVLRREIQSPVEIDCGLSAGDAKRVRDDAAELGALRCRRQQVAQCLRTIPAGLREAAIAFSVLRQPDRLARPVKGPLIEQRTRKGDGDGEPVAGPGEYRRDDVRLACYAVIVRICGRLSLR